MTHLFESLDISESLREELQEKIEERIQEEAVELAERVFNEKREEVLQDMRESYLNETAEKLDDYLSIVAEEFAEELAELKEEEVKQKQLDSVIEGVGAVLTAAGIDIASIVKIAEDGVGSVGSVSEEYDREISEELAETKTRASELVNEKIKLQKEKEALIKVGLVTETALEEGLSLMQIEKLKRIAASLDESLSLEEFNEKIEEFARDIVGDARIEKPERSQRIQESRRKNTFIPSHLI